MKQLFREAVGYMITAEFLMIGGIMIAAVIVAAKIRKVIKHEG